jgi:hypothetical protein
MHGATCSIRHLPDNAVAIAVFFSGNRIRFTEQQSR